MKISFDPAKREATLRGRGLDFNDSAEVCAGKTLDFEDTRFEYSETRMITAGHLRGRLVILVWTQRGETRHIISMRKANERERARFARQFRERLGED
ncbi:MAG: BrnT family toxin [Methylobacteriaceae bacterium]|nr:BrnT family toxin [Methylobacteriaceae bacterium]